MNMFLASPDNNGLCTKETAVTKVVTATRLIPATSAHMLVNGGDRYTRDSFIEAWLYAHVGEIPVVYIHDGNDIMNTLFRQLMPNCLQIGGGTLVQEYDPLRDIPLQRFFSELIARDPAVAGRVSLPYIKGIATLLLVSHYEPTLYRLNSYASTDLGVVIRRHADDLDDDTYALLKRCMNRSDSSIEQTLDFLDLLCDACGGELNLGRMDRGKSILSALRHGHGVSIDTRKLTNPLAASIVAVQLQLAKECRIPYCIVLDLNSMIPDTISTMLSQGDSARLALFACPNIWSAVSGNSTLPQHLLAIQNLSVFFPNGNMALSHDLSKYLDTYWRENRTHTSGTNRGRSRRSFSILPVNANGTNTGISVQYVRDTLMSANELRKLPPQTGVIIAQSVKPIVISPIAL